jgi:hypothetical protein
MTDLVPARAEPAKVAPATVAKSRLARFGPVVVGLLCALACAVPAIGASLVAGTTARVLGAPVWTLVAGVGALAVVWSWHRRHARRGC